MSKRKVLGAELMVAGMYFVAFIAGLNMMLSTNVVEIVKFGMLTVAGISSALITGVYGEVVRLRMENEEIREMLRGSRSNEPN